MAVLAAFGLQAIGVPTVVAIAVAVAVAFAVEWLLDSSRHRTAGVVAIAMPAIAVCAALILIDWSAVTERDATIFLFVGVLPLLNAIFDMVSYGATLALLQVGRRHLLVLTGALDFVLALFLFVLLGTTLVVVISLMNKVTGIEFADLTGLLNKAGDVRDYWWLYAMVFSTAIPTVAHLIAVGLAAQVWIGAGLRAALASRIKRYDDDDVPGQLATVLTLATLWGVASVLPFVVLGLLGWAFWAHGLEAFLLAYREFLIWLVDIVGVAF